MEFKSKFIPLYKLLQLLKKITGKVLKLIMNNLNNNSFKVKIAIITEKSFN